ncbi:MAG: hypothetical protein ACI83O_000334 [Patescibacteria group bacterium]|jgi:hypothetical protein
MAKTNCDLCKNPIQYGLMNKILGTTITIKREEKKEKKIVCQDCQKEHNSTIKDQF